MAPAVSGCHLGVCVHAELLQILREPGTRRTLTLGGARDRDGEIESGWLVAAGGAARYEIRGFVPRFVGRHNYADNFGMQWQKFRQTQLDSYSGHPISASRFWKATGWDAAAL